MTQETQSSPVKLSLEVGKFYYDRGNRIHGIAGVVPEDQPQYAEGYRFFTDLNLLYRADGTCNDDIAKEDESDLIAEVIVSEALHHPHIGLDDHRVKHYSELGETIHMNPHIGPHQNRELNLMRAGLKPAVMLNGDEFDAVWRAAIEENGWVFHYDEPRDGYYIAPPEEAWRTAALRIAFDHVGMYGAMFQAHSDTIGGLLGYRHSDLEHFNRRVALIDHLREEFLANNPLTDELECPCESCQAEREAESTKRVLH